MNRGRRPKRPRLLRIDAAVDAMAPLGFTEKQVKTAVKELLKVYDGNDAWPVIEESSYALLIDVLLADAATIDKEKEAEDGNILKGNLLDEGTSAGVSSKDIGIQHDESVYGHMTDTPKLNDGIAALPCLAFEPMQSDNVYVSFKNDENPKIEYHPIVKSPSNIPSPHPIQTLPMRRRWPCHGWIESDEEGQDDFIYLNPYPALQSRKHMVPEHIGSLREGIKSQQRRKSRWAV